LQGIQSPQTALEHKNNAVFDMAVIELKNQKVLYCIMKKSRQRRIKVFFLDGFFLFLPVQAETVSVLCKCSISLWLYPLQRKSYRMLPFFFRMVSFDKALVSKNRIS